MEINKVAVLGCGIMGRFIAGAVAGAGIPTIIFKMTQEDKLGEVREKFYKGLDKEKQDVVQKNLSWYPWAYRVQDIKDCDLVIEAIPEKLSEKQELFKEISLLIRPNTILASNTSTLSVADLAKEVIFPERFIGMHFFNPPAVAKLVEVVQTRTVDPGVVEEVQSFVRKLGLIPLVVADTPGFVVNRLMMNDLIYAILCLENKLAKMENMDMRKFALVHPMGPFELCDHIGLDTVFSMATILHKDLQDDRFKPPRLLRRLVENHMLGKKSKLGFYDYTAKPKHPNPEVSELINLDKGSLAW